MPRRSRATAAARTLLALLALLAACDPGAADSRSEPAGELYFRMVTRFGYGGSMYFDPEFFFLLPGNRVYRGVPPQGLEAFDYDAARASDPAHTGTYEIDGGTFRATWADGSTSEYAYEEREDGNFALDGIFTGKVQSFGSGRSLDGTWTHLAAAGGGGIGLSSSQTIELRPDGTFRESSLATLSVESTAGTVGDSAGEGGEGTYELSGNTLSLTYGDGRTARFSAFPFGEDAESESPEIININGRMMHREEG